MSQELAWAAGLFDGEGSFTAWKAYQGSFYFNASIHQADRQVLDRFQKVVGVGKVYGPYKPTGLGKKLMYEFMSHNNDAHHIFELLMPYLSPIKIAQGQAALQKCAHNEDRRRKITDYQRQELLVRLKNKERGVDIAKSLGITQKVVSYYKRFWEKTKMLDKDEVDIEAEESIVSTFDEDAA